MTRPIPLTSLENYVKQLEVSGDWLTEFENLGDPTIQTKSMSAAELSSNILKHRYPQDNLGAYDETRVILPKNCHNSTDYINANWINGFDGKRRYIVTQAPLDSTMADFYRMIWENNVHQIVMLASLHDLEMDKCTFYYPEDSSTFGDIQVTLEKKTYHDDIVKRVYSIRQGKLDRVLVHYHFTSWPDRSVPEDPGQILHLIQMYRNSDTFCTTWPLLVHCSAGVGRTGSFLLADIVYDMAENEDSVDFLKHLCLLRNQRISMVEKPEQYFHPHQVILLGLQKGHFKTISDLNN